MRWCDYFTLDADSPSGLTWNLNIHDSTGRLTKARKGRFAGSLSGQGRWQVKIGAKVYRCHRIIYEMTYGEIPDGYYVDHIDGDAKNNALTNLRIVTPSENLQNTKKRSHNTSGITGINWWTIRSGLYIRASIQIEGACKNKVFSVNKYGLMEAFKLAVLWRKREIWVANANGACFTERHGK